MSDQYDQQREAKAGNAASDNFEQGPGRFRIKTIVAAAIVLIGAGLVLTTFHQTSGPARLSITTPSEITTLGSTLNPGQAQAMVSAALTCKVPLGHVEVWHDAGATDAPIRIQSGDYVSPSFMLTSVPEIIAIPYPAPYAAGAGTLTVLGTAQAVELSLSPTKAFANVSGAAPVNVTWDTGNPCP